MLYFVATPIGNLEEMTFRAVNVLKQSDIIYAEDTRHSAQLLKHYDIDVPLASYQKWSEKSKLDEIITFLKDKKTVSIISDAGMPLISDPGLPLVERLIAEDLEFSVVSGACAVINALVLGGLDTKNFVMLGFLPEKKSDKDKLMQQISRLPFTLVFYVPPHDIAKILKYLFDSLGARRVSVVREISKKFECVHRGVLGTEFELTQKGEMVVLVEGASENNACEELTVLQHLKMLIEAGEDKREAIKLVAKERNLPKSEVYKISLTL